MALDSIPAAPVIPAPPSAKAGAAGTFKATSSAGSHSSSASASADTSAHTADAASGNGSSGGSAQGPAKAAAHSKANSASNSAAGASSSKNAAAAPTSAAAAGAKSGTAAQPRNGAESNFLQALAQSQAAAANDASAAAGAASAAPAENSDDKSKPASDAGSDAAATALAFASQSLAGAVAVQQPANPPPTPAATAAQDDSAGAISLTRGSSTQDILSMLTKDGADGTKSAADALTNAASAPTPDSNSTSATAIQAAQMSVGSHFGIQHAAANQDTTAGDLRAPVGTTAFNDELGGKLTWMAHQGVESGSLQLSPEHLGPLEVRIQVQDGAASVWFGANHADTRAALEQALPHLRQMFASQGLTLSDAGVSREPPRGQAQKPAVAAVSSTGGSVGGDQGSIVSVSVSSRRSGLLDTYA